MSLATDCLDWACLEEYLVIVQMETVYRGRVALPVDLPGVCSYLQATGGRKTPTNRRLGASTGNGSSQDGFPHAHDGRTDHFGGYSNSSSPPRENYGFAAVGIVADNPDVATPPGDRSILMPQQEEQTEGFGDGDEVRIRCSPLSMLLRTCGMPCASCKSLASRHPRGFSPLPLRLSR